MAVINKRLELAESALLSVTELDLAVFCDLLRPNDESQITAKMAHVKETSSNYALHSSNTHPGMISTTIRGANMLLDPSNYAWPQHACCKSSIVR